MVNISLPMTAKKAELQFALCSALILGDYLVPLAQHWAQRLTLSEASCHLGGAGHSLFFRAWSSCLFAQ